MKNISGFINYNKQSGVSSAAAVAQVKRLTGMPCGHMGTLDPLASGVLPIAVGNASRLFNYLLDKEKVYRAVFRFGMETDTIDITGKVLRSGASVPGEADIRGCLSSFIGTIDQVPPAYSAKNIGGVRAYQLARAGKEVALQPKKVRIDGLELVRRISEDSFEFLITCGGGTYIRSLARDIAEQCGTCATMTSLVREKSGIFTIEHSVTKDELLAADWTALLIPPDSVLDMENVFFEGREAERLRQGQRLISAKADGEYQLYLDGSFYGIASVAGGVLRAKTKLV